MTCNLTETELPGAATGTIAATDCDPAGASMGKSDIFVRMYPADGSAPQSFQIGTGGYDYVAEIEAALSGGIGIVGTTSGTLGSKSFGSRAGYLWQFLP